MPFDEKDFTFQMLPFLPKGFCFTMAREGAYNGSQRL